MYKNIEILDKKKFKNLKFDMVSPLEVGKTIGVVPLGFNEVIDMACCSPVLIMGDENLEFVAFTGISSRVTIFDDKTLYIPMFLQAYPFLNVILKDKKSGLKSVIGIDKGEFCGDKKEKSIFLSDGKLDDIASKKVDIVKKLNFQRDISKKIINELKKYDLLETKDFKINMGDEEKTIINQFFIVNRKKLIGLPDDIVALWAKKGWMTLIDMHIKSLANFQRIFEK
ncbi:MAG: SapC family protein [Arcobacteraceae bacterium]|nr:SapC family protein [Arcobacteraceae bacterium]